MAKNFKASEGIAVVLRGSIEDKMDIGRRFPLFTILAAQANEAAEALMEALPEHITVRQIESRLKGDAQESTDGEEEVATPAPKAEKAAPAAKETNSSVDPYAGKTAKELYDICKKRGIEVETKQTAEAYAKILKKAAKDKQIAAEKAAKATKPAADEWGDDEPAATPAPKADKKAKAEKPAADDDWDL